MLFPSTDRFSITQQLETLSACTDSSQLLKLRGKLTSRKQRAHASLLQTTAGEEHSLAQILQERKAEQKEWKTVNISKQQYSANAPFQEEAPFAEHQHYMGQKSPARMTCG